MSQAEPDGPGLGSSPERISSALNRSVVSQNFAGLMSQGFLLLHPYGYGYEKKELWAGIQTGKIVAGVDFAEKAAWIGAIRGKGYVDGRR